VAAGGTFTSDVSSALASSVAEGTVITVESTESTGSTSLSGTEISSVPTTNEDSLEELCKAGELLVGGYVTGQMVEMNYDSTQLYTDASGNTGLEVHFTVPARFAAQYQAASFAITWHDRDDEDADKSGCFTNRGSVNDPYPNCPTSSTWNSVLTSENPCFVDYSKRFSWSNIMAGQFRAPSIQDNGSMFETYFAVDVEQWVFFDASSIEGSRRRLAAGYVSEKGTGYSEHYEAQNNDFAERTLNIIDERYTFSQIPFVLRFPKTVEVATSFQAGTRLTMLAGIIKQDTIRVNFNPSQDDGHFVYVDVHVVTEVQYPYGIRHYQDSQWDGAGAAQIILTDGMGNVVQENVSWRDMDHPSSCGGVLPGGLCEQTMEFRIKPTTCEANSNYQVKAFAKCVSKNDGCAVDPIWAAEDQGVRELSNSYVTFDFAVRTGNFCPEVVDDYRIIATPEIWLNEYFEEDSDLVAEGGNVFSNDWVYFKFNYAGYSASMPNGVADASKDVIDFSRAIKVFMDVELPATPVSQGGNFDDILLPASLDNDVSSMDFISVPGSTAYRVLICETSYTTAAYPIRNNNVKANASTGELIDCFNDKIYPNAKLYLDAGPITTSPVEEKDIAFGMRLDERIIPVDRYNNENTKVAMTVEAEVYWTGNKHPSRRRLQGLTDPAADADSEFGPRTTNARNIASTTLKTRSRNMDTTFCEVASALDLVYMDLYIAYFPGKGPGSMLVTDYVAAFQYEVADTLKMDISKTSKIWIVSITEGDDATTFVQPPIFNTTDSVATVMEASKRRLQALGDPSKYKIRFQIFSDGEKTGGRYANVLQSKIMDKRSDLYTKSAFEGAQVYKMELDECNAGITSFDTSKLESEASGVAFFKTSASVILAVLAATML